MTRFAANIIKQNKVTNCFNDRNLYAKNHTVLLYSIIVSGFALFDDGPLFRFNTSLRF